MRVCVVGAGGREHALAHVLARTADVVVTPGNPGTARRPIDGNDTGTRSNTHTPSSAWAVAWSSWDGWQRRDLR